MKLKTFVKEYYPAYLVLISLVAFSTFAYFDAYNSVKLRRQRLFQTRVQRVTEMVDNRMASYIQILKGCQGLFYASDSVTANDFKNYNMSLQLPEEYAGIQALAVAEFIDIQDTSTFQKKIRAQNIPDYKIKSTFINQKLGPIIFIEPINERNLRAMGFDLYSEINRRDAMNKALLTGKAAITKKIKLVQETDKDIQPGFLIFLPLYHHAEMVKTIESRRKNIRGFVSNVFRAHDLLGPLLQSFRELDIEIYDNEIKYENLLYKTAYPSVKHTRQPFKYDLKSDTSIAIAGNYWKFRIIPNETFGSTVEKQQPALIFICGLIISTLVFILALHIIKRKDEIALQLERSKALENKKDEFIGIASHELKTPLTSIKASLQLLERSDLNNRDKSFVSKANININKLNHLIGDLLDVSKIQAGRLQLNIAAFPLSELIDDSVENVQHSYSTHQIIKTQLVPDILITGDKFRLEQALTNLLVNGIKYSPAADKIFVSTKVTKTRVSIEIKDLGIGISKTNQKKIFERFFRAEDLSPVISGLGMGLYISYEIVKRHHGEISVNSELGKGSVFSIHIPFENTVIS